MSIYRTIGPLVLYKCLHCIASDGSNDGRNKKGKRSSSGSRASQSQKRGSKSRKRKKGSDPSFSEVNSICIISSNDVSFW